MKQIRRNLALLLCLVLCLSLLPVQTLAAEIEPEIILTEAPEEVSSEETAPEEVPAEPAPEAPAEADPEEISESETAAQPEATAEPDYVVYVTGGDALISTESGHVKVESAAPGQQILQQTASDRITPAIRAAYLRSI